MPPADGKRHPAATGCRQGTSVRREEEVSTRCHRYSCAPLLATVPTNVGAVGRLREMAVFYRGHTLLITNDVVEVWWPSYQRFSVPELHGVYVFRDVTDPVVVRGIGASALMLVATGATWHFVPSPVVALIGVLVVLAPLLAGSACLRTRRPPWELRAMYRGVDVQLYSSRDALTFGQVKRALVRAIEANDP